MENGSDQIIIGDKKTGEMAKLETPFLFKRGIEIEYLNKKIA